MSDQTKCLPIRRFDPIGELGWHEHADGSCMAFSSHAEHMAEKEQEVSALQSENDRLKSELDDAREEIAEMRQDWAELGSILGLFPQGRKVSFDNFMCPEDVKPAVAAIVSKLAIVADIAKDMRRFSERATIQAVKNNALFDANRIEEARAKAAAPKCRTRQTCPTCNGHGGITGYVDGKFMPYACPDCTTLALQVSDEWVLLPRALTAENGAKYALIGEFFATAGPYRMAISWPTIKEIYAAIVKQFAQSPVSADAPQVDDATESFLADVRAELIRARAKFPGDRIMTIALAEEFGELCKAVLDESSERVRKEAVQTAVMAVRVAIDGDGSVREWRHSRGLDAIGQNVTVS